MTRTTQDMCALGRQTRRLPSDENSCVLTAELSGAHAAVWTWHVVSHASTPPLVSPHLSGASRAPLDPFQARTHEVPRYDDPAYRRCWPQIVPSAHGRVQVPRWKRQTIDSRGRGGVAIEPCGPARSSLHDW